MLLQFHHFFIFVPKGAPLVDHLQNVGFSEGSRNTHSGQGTANRRLFFQNGMLEFIWADNLSELKSPITASTRLWERSQYQSSGFSPFGICLCPSADTREAIEEPFLGWAYHPQYIPPGYSIWVAANDACPWEPMIFYLPFVRLHGPDISGKEPIHHPNGAQRIDKITVTMRTPRGDPSDAAQKLKSVGRVELLAGDRPHAEIKIMGNSPSIIDLTQWCPLKIILQERTQSLRKVIRAQDQVDKS